MLFFLLLMLLFRSVCHQVSNQADKLDLLAIFIISRRFAHLNRWAKRRLIIKIARRSNLSTWYLILSFSNFETGKIIPEVFCITKPAIKNVHFCTELSKVASLVATPLVFLLQFLKCRKFRDTILVAVVSQKWWSSHVFPPSVWHKLVSASVAKKPYLKLLFQYFLENIDTPCAERDRKTRMSDIVAIAFLATGNCDEVLMTKLRTWLQQWVCMAKGYNSFTLAWTLRYFPLILLAPS